MTTEAFVLVIIAAALHATWNLVSKKAAAGAGDFVFAYRSLSAIFYAPWVVYILAVEGMHWSMPVVLFIALSSLLHLGYSLCLQWGYHAADLSVVYPVARGTGPLLASLGAYMWLGERPSVLGVAGILCIVAGILLIATGGDLRRFASPRGWIGVQWGGLIGLFIAAYTVADAYSVKVLLVAPVILDWLSALGNALLLSPRAWVRRRAMMAQMRGKWRYAATVGALSPMAYILVLYAYRLGGQVSLIAPLREVSLMLATVAGFFILGEKASFARLAGCAVIIAGVILLSV